VQLAQRLAVDAPAADRLAKERQRGDALRHHVNLLDGRQRGEDLPAGGLALSEIEQEVRHDELERRDVPAHSDRRELGLRRAIGFDRGAGLSLHTEQVADAPVDLGNADPVVESLPHEEGVPGSVEGFVRLARKACSWTRFVSAVPRS